MRVDSFLAATAARFPDKPALIAGETRLTYGELDRLSSALAAGLAANGVARDDRVLVFFDNCWEAAVAIFAILKAGATFSTINPSTKADKLAFIVNHCRPSAILMHRKASNVLSEALAGTTIQPRAIVAGGVPDTLPGARSFEQLLETEPLSVPHGGIDLDLAMLIYTSGSTGRPKGVMMTHRNIEAASASVMTCIEASENDIILSVLPLSFNYGLYQLLMSVRTGSTLILEKSFAFPQAIFERIRSENVTGLPLVPTMVAMILNTDLAPGSLPSLRYITNTAATLPPAHITRLQALIPSADIFSMYGLTECKRCTFLPPSRLADKPDSVGIAVPNTEVMVIDDSGTAAAPGVIGELVVRGPHVMAGYWEDPEATAKALLPGKHPWEKRLATGDLFYADTEGFLYFVGRKDDIIKTRGEKVAPKEVEAALITCPGVTEAVVAGVADPLLGYAVNAMVVRTDNTLTERDVIRHCMRHLEDFMVPKRIVFVAELPKTDTGKVSRRLAAESLEHTS